MLDVVPPAGQLPDGHQVEPVLVVRPAMAKPPEFTNPSNDAAFAPSDRFHRRTAGEGAPCLDLDERDQPIPPGHEIEIVPAPSVPMGFDVPTTSSEVGQGRPFARQSAPLPCVLPLGDGNEPPGLAHARE